MEFSRREDWSGLSCFSPGNLSEKEGAEPASPVSPALQADSLPSEPPGKPKQSWEKSAKLEDSYFPISKPTAKIQNEDSVH